VGVVALRAVGALPALVPEPAHDGLVFTRVRCGDSTATELVSCRLRLVLGVGGLANRGGGLCLARFRRRLGRGTHYLLLEFRATTVVGSFLRTSS